MDEFNQCVANGTESVGNTLAKERSGDGQNGLNESIESLKIMIGVFGVLALGRQV